MKKILFGSAAAILTVVGFSAFKTPNHLKAAKQYFLTQTLAVSGNPQIPSGTTVELFESGDHCTGTTNYCIITINSLSVNANQTKVSITTTPASTFQRKS